MGETVWLILCVLVIYGGQTYSSVMPGSDEVPSVDLSNFEAFGVGKHSPLLKLMEKQHFEQHSKLNALISHVVQHELRLEKYIADKFASQDVMFTQRIKNMEKSMLNRIGSMMDIRNHQSFNDAVELSQTSTDSTLQNMKGILDQKSRELQKSFETMASSLEKSLEKWSGKDLKMTSVMDRMALSPQQRPDDSDQDHEGSGYIDYVESIACY